MGGVSGEVRELRPCGTPAAYRRHIRRGEDVCKLCRKAHAAYEKARWTAARQVAA